MFTLGAFVLMWLLVWWANRRNDREALEYEAPQDSRHWVLFLHIRQDLKLIAFLLVGILIMLGVLADAVIYTKL